jgi:hypothetical protein
MTPIRGILKIINSKPDIYGNSYYAFEYTNTMTQHTIRATSSGGHSNIAGIPFYLHDRTWEPRDIFIEAAELKIREFNRLVKNWPHAGCLPEDLADYIKTPVGY